MAGGVSTLSGYVMCTYCETFNSPAYNHRYNCSPDMLKERLKGDEFYCT